MAAVKLYDLARMTTATVGTGTITLGVAVSPFLSFAQAGVQNGDFVRYAIYDPASGGSEIGSGTYTASGTTLTRNPTTSTAANAAINLSGSAQVFITASAIDFLTDALIINPTLPPYNAKGDGVTDDTAAWVAIAAAINAAGGGWVISPPGLTYLIWPNAPTTQSVLMAFANVTGLKIDMQGSKFNVAYTGTSVTYVIELTNCVNVEINGFTGTAASGKHVSGDNTGVNWIQASDQTGSGFGVKQLTIRRMNITGGLTGLAIVRALGSGSSFSENIAMDGTFTNVGYPMANESDGLNTVFDFTSVNAGRSYIGYNVWGVKGRINSVEGASLNDIEIACYGYHSDLSENTTANIDIEYINRNTTSYGASLIALSHQQGDTVSHQNIATTISNVHFHLDIALNSSPNFAVYEENSFVGYGASQSPGDPGNTNDNIILSGKIEGDVAYTYLGHILSATVPGGSSGYNGTSKGTYHLRDLQVPNATKPWTIGIGATVTFDCYTSPNANYPTLEAGVDWELISVRQPCVFANTGSVPIQGYTNFWDQSGQGYAYQVCHGFQARWFNSSDALVGTIGAGSGNFDVYSRTTVPLRFGYNGSLYWNVGASGILQPVTDATSPIGDATHRVSNIFGVTGTFSSLAINGGTISPWVFNIAAGQSLVQGANETSTVTDGLGTTDNTTWAFQRIVTSLGVTWHGLVIDVQNNNTTANKVSRGALIVLSCPVGNSTAHGNMNALNVFAEYAGTGGVAGVSGGAMLAGNIGTGTVSNAFGYQLTILNSGGGTNLQSTGLKINQPVGATIGLTSTWTSASAIEIVDQNPSGAGTNTLSTPPIGILIDSQTASGAFAIKQLGSGLVSFASPVATPLANLTVFTVTTLPTSGRVTGSVALVSDATSNVVIGAGGGTAYCLVTWNGAAWVAV